jgi:hypothetical protein
VESHTTVIIPFNDRGVFVGLRNCAEILQSDFRSCPDHDAISGIQFLAGPRGRGGFLARSEAGVAPGYDRAVTKFWAVHVAGSYFFVSFQAADGYAAAFVATFYLLDLSSVGLEKMVPLFQTGPF